MRKVAFKERDAKGIKLFWTKADMSLADLEKTMMRKGWFSVGYNYIIHPDGSTDAGIPSNQCCEPSLDGWDTNICVLITGQVTGKMTALQSSAVEEIAKETNLKVVD